MLRFAITAGNFGALGSVFGKMALSSTHLEIIALTVINSFTDVPREHLDMGTIKILQVLSFATMLLCNAMVCTFYGRALQASPSSLPPTVISIATNFVSSAVLGLLIFNETTGILWWFGFGLVVIGLAFISHGHQTSIKNKEE